MRAILVIILFLVVALFWLHLFDEAQPFLDLPVPQDYSHISLRVQRPISESLPQYGTHKLIEVEIDSVDCYKVRVITATGEWTERLRAPSRVVIYESTE